MQPPNNNPDFPSYNDPLPPTGSSYGGGPSGGYPTPPSRPQISFDVISEAWKVIQPHLGIYIAAIFILMVIVGFFAGIQATIAAREAQANSPTLLPQLIGFVIQIVTQLLSAGFYRMAINHLKTGAPYLGDLFTTFDVFLSLIVAAILTQIAILIGCCACIVGMFVVNGLLMFTIPLIVDKRMNPIQAISTSFEATKEQWLPATGFMFVIGLLAAAGILACGVGVLVTAPLALMAVVLTYRNFFMTGDSLTPGAAYPNAPIADPGI